MANKGSWIVDISGDDAPIIIPADMISGCPINGKRYIIIRLDPTFINSAGFVARYHSSGLQIWEFDLVPPTYFITNGQVTEERFFSFLAEHYPQDLTFILFHPELFRREFEP